jgi:trimethylamine--corrinoid protein Co-methyltransferase
MKTQCQFLSENEQILVHEKSIRILEEIGVKFFSDKALKVLEKNGAKVDYSEKLAKIPREMVDQALKTAPKSFVLGARNPEFDAFYPSAHTGYVLDCGGVFTYDYKSSERRYSTLQDCEQAFRVFEDMSLGSYVWPHSVPDLEKTHPYSSQIKLDISALMFTSKHVQDELTDPREVPYMIEGMKAILGSEDAVKERKIFSVCYCTLAPLSHDDGMSEALMDLSEFEIPILIFPMPCAGSTGPASLFSNIAMGNAEALSSVVLFQMAHPGTPLIYGDASGSTQFSTGGFLEGSPEMVLMSAARGEMAKLYGLPNTQAGCLSDAKAPGPQAVMEKLLTTLPLVLSGVDYIQGPGAIETSGTLCLEQIVVDEEIARLCKRMRDGIDTSDEKDFFEDINSVKPGGHFLMQPNTVKACRSEEFLMPLLSDRHTFESWAELGRPDLYSEAQKKVEEILDTPQKHPLPDDVIGKLEEIIRQAEEELTPHKGV